MNIDNAELFMRELLLGLELKMGIEDPDVCIVCYGAMFFVKKSDCGKLAPENPIENLIILLSVDGFR